LFRRLSQGSGRERHQNGETGSRPNAAGFHCLSSLPLRLLTFSTRSPSTSRKVCSVPEARRFRPTPPACPPQSKMHGSQAGGSITDAGGHVVVLSADGLGDHLMRAPMPSRLLRVPSRAMSSQCAAPGLRFIQISRMGQRGGYDVDSAVQVQVAKGAAAMPRHGVTSRPASSRGPPTSRWRPGCGTRCCAAPRPVRAGKRAHVAAGDKQVFQPSLSKSNKPGPNPACSWSAAHSALGRHFAKDALPVFRNNGKVWLLRAMKAMSG